MNDKGSQDPHFNAPGEPPPPAPGFEPAAPVATAPLAQSIGTGAAAAVLGALAWYFITTLSGWEIGFVSIGVGFLVGFALAHRADPAHAQLLGFVGAGMTLLGMAVAEYFIIRWAIIDAFGSAPGLPFFDTVRASIEDDPITLVFWGIAVWQAYVIPQRIHTARPAMGGG